MDISFSSNWNNKLQCQSFTTIRLFCPAKYEIGNSYQIFLNGQLVKSATIFDIKNFYLKDISNYISYLDANLSPEEFKLLMIKFYGKKCNIDTQLFSFILLKTIK